MRKKKEKPAILTPEMAEDITVLLDLLGDEEIYPTVITLLTGRDMPEPKSNGAEARRALQALIQKKTKVVAA